jgi:hypothetical protein
VSSETLLTPPTASAGLGSLVVTAVDRNNVKLTGLSVLRAASGTTPAETQTIGEDGCVLFTNLPAAN